MIIKSMNLYFKKLIVPASEIAEAFNRWENDAGLIPFTRPNRNKEELEHRETVSLDDLTGRLLNSNIFLIYSEGQLIGEMSYSVDPEHLFKKEKGTAWIGITIGERSGRGKGIGGQAMKYLEDQIRLHGLKRIELGVFEFNSQAIRLYKKLGYTEIGRIQDFTFWQGRMWQDIRMEKYVQVKSLKNG
ncbi:MAG: GNAT family N-acetyltransferase [Candidatus Delongbacteria bacterium]|jgi:RimJ/RimL family protein N-acetyltransferase|nr:GNAT family N-acetyltransferase [Candidatus Delongbacteria bacterium]